MRRTLRAVLGASLGLAMAVPVVAMPAVALPAKKDRGGLRVVAEGVPQGRSASVMVAGRKFRKKVPAAGKLRNLRPGSYRVWATPIVTNGGTAAVPNLPVRVRVPKRASTTLRLQYQWSAKSDIYPPGPVTDLSVTGRSATSVALRWVNSTAPDLYGVEIRRALGEVPPAHLDEGEEVAVSPHAHSVVDEGLAQYTAYSYSVFMVDEAGNASPPASVSAQTAGRAARVTAGTQHTCALLLDDEDSLPGTEPTGRVVCWGRNDHGQLGVGDGSSHTPQAVDLGQVVQVVAGGDHTCARQRDGSVWCWGRNDHGQLGNGSVQDSSTPVRAALDGTAALALGGNHTCALSRHGGLRCWGSDEQGQSAHRMDGPVLSPPSQPVLTDVTSVGTGWAHTCAVQKGHIHCFGENGEGQLGDGTVDSSAVPVTVDGLQGQPVESVVAGVQHTCALLVDSGLACWGGNSHGQVGDGTTGMRRSPLTVLSGVSAVAAGAYHTCAGLENATMRCWGRNNSGRLGDGSETDRLVPARVAIAAGVSAIAAGGYHSCAISGAASYCWGANPFGQLGGSGTWLRPHLVDGL